LWLMGRLPKLEPGQGLEFLVETLRGELPSVRLGNFTRPLPGPRDTPALLATS